MCGADVRARRGRRGVGSLRLTPVQVWGTITRLDDDSILLENSNESNPNSEIIVHLSETTYLIDAVTGDPMKAEDLKDGDTVYAWVGPAMALSLPPQAAATIVLGEYSGRLRRAPVLSGGGGQAPDRTAHQSAAAVDLCGVHRH